LGRQVAAAHAPLARPSLAPDRCLQQILRAPHAPPAAAEDLSVDLSRLEVVVARTSSSEFFCGSAGGQAEILKP
jgi:hypothetical protein